MRDVVSFFVSFERALLQSAPPGVMESSVRDVEKLLECFELYSNCKYTLLSLDFSEDIESTPPEAHTDVATPHALWSLVLNYGDHALVIINSMTRPGVSIPLVDKPYQRFLAIKEAYHVVLRDEFIRQGLSHPDASSPERLVTITEELTYLPFSIVDFDSPDYPDSVKVENSAELLALLTLYPLDDIAADRERFLGANGAHHQHPNPKLIVSSTSDFADERGVPQRYIDLLFRWYKFDELYYLYRQLRDGISAF